MQRTSRLSVALVAALVIGGCAARGVRIAELRDQPGRYDNKSVSVSGTVTDSWGIPLFPFQLYRVDDGSGEITVVSSSSRAPIKGQEVKVKGRVSEVATLAGRSVGLHIEEQDRSIRR
jgi:hypothetical protein